MDDGFIGVDPGMTGACCLLVKGRMPMIFDWPGEPRIMAAKIAGWQKRYNIKFALIEKVSAMPGQGVTSMFKFGTNFGMWQGIISSLGIPYDLVSPRKWQKGLITPTDGKDSKERSLNVSRRLFPNALDMLKRKKDHNRSDALLLAKYAMDNYG